MSKLEPLWAPFTEDLLRKLAAHIREKRQEDGWSIRSLAAECRMSTKTIRVLEQGQQRVPTLKTVDKVASALKVDTASLLGEVVSPRSASSAAIEHALASNLVRYRQMRHWTQEQLSQASGVGREHLAHIEREDQNPTLETLVRLALALSVSVELLVGVPSAGED